MGGMALTHGPKVTLTPSPSPGQVQVGKPRHGRIHGHQPPPAPARGHPAVTQEGGRELAGSWHSRPARLVQPAQLLWAVADGTRLGAPSRMSTHRLGGQAPREGWKHLKETPDLFPF